MYWLDQWLVFAIAFKQSLSVRLAFNAMWIARGVYAALWLYQEKAGRPTFSETSTVISDFVNWLEAHQYEQPFFETPSRYLHLYFQTHDWEACLPRSQAESVLQ